MSAVRLCNVTVVGEGPVNGTWVRVVLAVRQATSPDRAMSFLRRQARRIASGLDPDPRSGWIPVGTLVRAESRVPDVPAELRSWCRDPEAQRAARNQLVAGGEFALSAADHSGVYLFRVLPVPAYVPAPGSGPGPGPEPSDLR
ncbi:hypothetical protein ACIBJC_09980 [Streptomyces sp. NPDC050509]|uniref:hypothetical protein n=1 Tax=Streptomyces sp. NPDC050509 TaxID=3365620 RepID=UPI0037B9AD6A